MCWIAHERGEPATAGQDHHEQILNELYGLTPAQVHLYDRVSCIVDEALAQFDKGYAVCVEEQTADLAKELVP